MAVTGVLLVTCLIPIWVTQYFPSQNGPWFLLPTHMLTEYGNPAYNYSDYFVRTWHPIPHMLHDALVGLFSLAVPLLIAEKLMLSVYVVLLPWSVLALLSVVAPEKKSLACLSFLMVLSYPFMRGYHDFTLSIPLFFFTLAYWMRHREALGKKHVAVLGVMAILVYLSHLFTFALLVGVIGWIRLFETANLKRAFAAALVATWPGWLLCVDYLWLNSQSSWIDKSDTEWLPFHRSVENFVRQYFHSVSFPAYVIAVAAWAWIPYCMLQGWTRARTSVAGVVRAVARQPFASLVVFLTVTYLLLPYKMLGWHKVNVRLVPFILGLLLVAVAQIPSLQLSRRLRNALVGTVLTATIAMSAFVTPEVIRMERHLQNYVSGIDKFDQNSLLLPIHLENPAFGQIRPLTRAHQYYHIAKGGANGGAIASKNTLSLMWYRSYPVEENFPGYDPNRPHASLAKAAKVYDYVLTMGEDAKVADALRASPFRLVHDAGNVRLYRNSGQARRQQKAATSNASSRRRRETEGTRKES